MHRLISAVFIAASVLMSASDAQSLQATTNTTSVVAETASDDCISRRGGILQCGKDDISVTVTPNADGSFVIRSASTSSGPVKTYLPYDTIRVGADGQPCIGTGYYEESTQRPRPVEGITDTEQGVGNISNVYGNAPPCPARPGVSGPLETRSMVARRHWEEVALPKPSPEIKPGRAITGKLAYLETAGDVSFTYSNSTVFGPLTITARGAYTVAWGDGSTTGPYAFEGESWPGGRIIHEYIAVGDYDILVTEAWTATWSLDGESGVLRTLETSGEITDFPVEQIQAVVAR